MASEHNVFISCELNDCSSFLRLLRQALDSRNIGYSVVVAEHLMDIYETSSSSGDTLKFLLIIISENYSSSEANLRYLVKARNEGHTVLPVFYHLSSSELAKVEGGFWTAFNRRVQNLRNLGDVINTCKAVLRDACYQYGWDVPSDPDDSQAAENIADEVNRRIRSGTDEMILESSDSSSLSDPTERGPGSIVAKIGFTLSATNILVELVAFVVGIASLAKKPPSTKRSLLGLSILSFLLGALELFYQIRGDGLRSTLQDISTIVEVLSNIFQLGAAGYNYYKTPQKPGDEFDPSSVLPIFFAILVADIKFKRLREVLRTN